MRSGLSPTTTEPEDEDAKRLITDDHDDYKFPAPECPREVARALTGGGRRPPAAELRRDVRPWP